MEKVLAPVLGFLGLLGPSVLGIQAATPSSTPFPPRRPPPPVAVNVGSPSALPGRRPEIVAAEIERKREELKARVATIRDKRKQEVVTRLGEKMNQINSRRVAHWRNVLDRLAKVLAKVEAKATEAKSNGKDTAKVEAAIKDAKTSIEVGRVAVEEQAGKVYAVTFGSENTLRNDVGMATKGEQADLRKVLEKINEARKKVALAIRELAKVLGEKVPPEATPSATPGVNTSL